MRGMGAGSSTECIIPTISKFVGGLSELHSKVGAAILWASLIKMSYTYPSYRSVPPPAPDQPAPSAAQEVVVTLIRSNHRRSSWPCVVVLFITSFFFRFFRSRVSLLYVLQHLLLHSTHRPF
jgi:hypothetical protein